MKQELKVRIADVGALESRLCELGATLEGRKQTIDTYYRQPPGRVLKLSESQAGAVLIRLVAREGGFVVESEERLPDATGAKARLAAEFGVKCVLEKSMSLYRYKEFVMGIHRIKDVGDFLIIEGENPSPELVTGALGLKNPEYITVSFDNLKRK